MPPTGAPGGALPASPRSPECSDVLPDLQWEPGPELGNLMQESDQKGGAGCCRCGGRGCGNGLLGEAASGWPDSHSLGLGLVDYGSYKYNRRTSSVQAGKP